MGFIEFLKSNFIHVLPIFIAAAVAIAIAVERIVALFQRYPIHNMGAFLPRICHPLIGDPFLYAI